MTKKILFFSFLCIYWGGSFGSVKASGLTCVERLAMGKNKFNTKINKKALTLAYQGLQRFRDDLQDYNQVLVVDYSKSSKNKRGYLIDFLKCEVLAYENVAHGGTVYTPDLIRYGDTNHDGILDKCVHANGTRTNMTRPGFMVTAGCHESQKDFPIIGGLCKGIKLKGLESRNDDVFFSGVVLHEHDQMTNDSKIKPEGQGCPIFASGRLQSLVQFGLWEGVLVYLHVPQCS